MGLRGRVSQGLGASERYEGYLAFMDLRGEGKEREKRKMERGEGGDI